MFRRLSVLACALVAAVACDAPPPGGNPPPVVGETDAGTALTDNVDVVLRNTTDKPIRLDVVGTVQDLAGGPSLDIWRPGIIEVPANTETKLVGVLSAPLAHRLSVDADAMEGGSVGSGRGMSVKTMNERPACEIQTTGAPHPNAISVVCK
ncbi:hypothetical protein JQX13_38850 [Archangium violaceum]|uniref:hypothetical protein n=1 Tax=Archangium violaceum TaxID=83451 RepID=UPI00193C09A7|nr:hypothetical protein [Archangium violaceum]QRK06042.1 hypothetical protein JQX13_38850 [Archangium violaceum]